MVPRGISLEGSLLISPIAVLGRAFAVSLEDWPASVPVLVSKELDPQAYPLLHLQAMVPEDRTFFCKPVWESPKL